MLNFEYEIKESARAKLVRVSVFADGRIQVTKPACMNDSHAEKFVYEKREWIDKMMRKSERAKKRAPRMELPRLRRGTKNYKEAQEQARELISERLAYFKDTYPFLYNRVFIRNQKTLWGSCSRAGNLNFNYKIIHLAPELVDYIIVHELCHLREMNHSKRFWELVAKEIPDHVMRRKQLRGFTLR